MHLTGFAILLDKRNVRRISVRRSSYPQEQATRSNEQTLLTRYRALSLYDVNDVGINIDPDRISRLRRSKRRDQRISH